ncbi:hypothetical protein BDP27DRAFT_1429089 [Rhodocollybia butyracea]|uniref:Uncharacterized protein n=1 Tax=Rhodocollybia butyracea TaxID=206335 RepID=A0A9P5PFW8_9AGAR|nr:hypothetical protein BDP27DRAFT_1429089 [Rhodocollybia butyracea]
MYHNLLLSIVSSCFVTVAGAFSITFPSGTIEALKPLNVTWVHSEGANAAFFLQKIRFGPDGISEPDPVDILNSTDNQGISTFEFDEPGLFEVAAIDLDNTGTLFATTVTVLSPTSEIITTLVTTLPKSTSSVSSTESSMSGATKNSVAAVAGGVAGGITGLVLLSITLILCWRRSRHKKVSLRIPSPFYNESDGNANGALVIQTRSRAQIPQPDRVGEGSPRVAKLTRENRVATSRSVNGAHNDSNSEAAIETDRNMTQVLQPPAYTSEYQA